MKLKPVLLAVAPAFCVGLFYAAIVTARATASFPFACTLISCKQLTPANIDRGSDAWSGSPSCGNVDTVVSQATFIRGLSQGLDYVVQCMFVPILSALSDSHGRRPLALLGVAGLLLSALLYTFAAMAHSSAWFVLSSITQGATAVVTPLMSAVCVDVATNNDEHKAAAFGLYASGTLLVLVIVVALVTTLVVAAHIYDYRVFSVVLLAAAALLLGTTFAYFPETLQKRRPWNRSNWIPLRSYRLFLTQRKLGILAVALFHLGFAIGAINTLQGFVVKVYSYSNEQSILIFILALAVLAVSCVCGAPLISRLGAPASLRAGIMLVTIGFCVLTFAQASPVFAYVGILVAASGGFATPAFLTIISRFAKAEEQGELQGAVNSVVLLSSGIGSAVLSAVFTAVRSSSFGAGLPFLIGAISAFCSFVLTSCALRMHANDEVLAVPLADDVSVIGPGGIELSNMESVMESLETPVVTLTEPHEDARPSVDFEQAEAV